MYLFDVDYLAVAKEYVSWLQLPAGVGAKMFYDWMVSKRKNKADVNNKDADTSHSQAETIKVLNQELRGSFVDLRNANDTIIELQNKSLDVQTAQIAELKIKDALLETAGTNYLALERQMGETAALYAGEIAARRRLRDKTKVGYWEADASGKPIFVNALWLKIFNVTEATIEKWLDAVIESDRKRVLAEWNRRVIDQDSATAFEFSIIDKDGRHQKVQSIYVICRRPDGEIYKIIGETLVDK